MRSLATVLVCLSAIGFVLAVIAVILGGTILGVQAEGFSRGCSNLALIAIAISVCCKCEGKDKAGGE